MKLPKIHTTSAFLQASVLHTTHTHLLIYLLFLAKQNEALLLETPYCPTLYRSGDCDSRHDRSHDRGEILLVMGRSHRFRPNGDGGAAYVWGSNWLDVSGRVYGGRGEAV